MKLIFSLFLLFSFTSVFLQVSNGSLIRRRPSSGRSRSSLRNQRFFIYKIQLGGRDRFYCNGKFFITFDVAFQHLMRVQPRLMRDGSLKNSVQLRHLHIQSVIGTSSLGKKIWKKVWGKCDISCFILTDISKFKAKVYEQMLLTRRLHHSGVLLLNDKLSREAQKRAEKMAKYGKYITTPWWYRYGETHGIVYAPLASTVVSKWYNEGKYYDYQNNKPREGLGSFSQLVWKGSKMVGIGVAKKNDELYVVCLYYPKGNKKGQFGSNVLRSSLAE